VRILRTMSLAVAALALLGGSPAKAGDKEDAEILVSAKRWEQSFQLYGKPFVFHADKVYTHGDGKRAGTWEVRDGKLTLTGKFLNTRTNGYDAERTFNIEWLNDKKLGFVLSEPAEKEFDKYYYGKGAFMKYDR
jgi:hypothetical protein